MTVSESPGRCRAIPALALNLLRETGSVVRWRATRTERRRRALAGDARAGSWARGRARTDQRTYVREHWLVFGSFVGGVWVLAVLLGWMTMPNPFVNGLVVGAALISAPVAVWVHALQVTGSAPTMMGDQAEQWTAQELRAATRRDWLLVNHLVLGTDDIDHVLLGPGGALVFETKWNGSPWDSRYGAERQRDAIRQAEANAHRLRLWHPFKSRHIPVRAVVVLWGQGLSKWPVEQQIRGIGSATVVTGPALRGWAEQLQDGQVAPKTVEQVWEDIEAQITRRDLVDLAAHPLPMSLAEWTARANLAVLAAVASLWTFSLLSKVTTSTAIVIAMSLTLAAFGPLIARLRPPAWARWAAWSWFSVLAALASAVLITAFVS
jgi:Nuclease-related domain